MRILRLFALIFFSVLGLLLLTQCGSKVTNGGSDVSDNPNQEEEKIDKRKLPVNLSVFIDLSDRIAYNSIYIERDMEIVDQLVDYFIDCSYANSNLPRSKNKFNIFFYPLPSDNSVAMLAKGLNADLSVLNPGEKKDKLDELKESVETNLSQIYALAIKDQKFIGCDIWGFFSDKKVDNLCMLPGYRNILVILTDGYLYHIENKKQEGNAYSYLNGQNLMLPGTSLIVARNGLQDLEVLMLELNPKSINQFHTMQEIIENWLRGMGVEHFMVVQTDVPVNTEKYVKAFLNN
ncbi:MAG: hypothetical protein K2L14_09060 [Duncaniella sp.]|nr:hypothetical protein [Duncaniella sp.]